MEYRGSLLFILSIVIVQKSFVVSSENRPDNTDIVSSSLELPVPQNKTPVPDVRVRILPVCEAFYNQYLIYAGTFTHCELTNAVPFRMCGQCIEDYAISASAFNDLMNLPDLEHCRKRYMNSDRVQVIPSVNRNIQTIWTDAHCDSCTSDVKVNSTTREVEYTIPKDVKKFLELFENFTACVNSSFQEVQWEPGQGTGNLTVCVLCKEEYDAMNDLYIRMSDNIGGGMCMDLVDMMNYTRYNWSSLFHCSNRSGDAVPVLIISISVAISPLLFYVTVRITGKQHKKKIFKQKRLGSSIEGIPSVSRSYMSSGGSRDGVRNRLNPFT